MVILLSALSVVAAAILLGAWFLVGGGFGLIYAAMALAAGSMVLLWAARWIGSAPDAVLPGEPAELPALVPDTTLGAATTGDLVGVSAGRPEPAPDASAAGDDLAEPVAEPAPAEPEPAVAGRGALEPDDTDAEGAPASGTGAAFPIADYDTLWLSQILPLLDELDDAGLAMVDARERGGRHRAAVLDAVASRRPHAAGGAGPAARPEPGAWEQGPAAGPVAPLAELELELEPDEPVAEVDADPEVDAEPSAGSDADPEGDTGPSATTADPAASEPSDDDDDPFGTLDPAAQAEEDRLWAAAVPVLDQGRDPFLDDDEPAPAATVDVLVAAAEGEDDWDVAEPDRWDWSGVRPAPAPVRSVEAVDLGADPDIVLVDDGPVGDAGPRVRTFLGRRRSPVTVRRA